MKALKIVIALIVSVIMICSTALALGSLATEKATSAESIRSAIDETGILGELMNEVLQKNTVNMGGTLGTAADKIMQTDPMKDFLAQYMTAAIESQIYGRGREEVANDELMEAFSAGAEDVAAEEGISLDSVDIEMIRISMQQTMPLLTDEIENSLNAYDTTSIGGQMKFLTDMVPLLVKPLFRYGYMAIAFLSALTLIIIFWPSRMGFMWAGVNTLIASGAFAVITLVAGSLGSDETYVETSQRMFYLMCADGTGFAAVAGGISGVLLVIICVIMRTVRRPI